ncbi:MAG: serine/threonine-protein kinase, partial [Gammaproteobacteria bacterium]|nr:serine/threonine-protein kinase [Gammaproteobacteria bacterium]
MEIPGYNIEHMLGQGGMGTVHLARDEKHERRRVALKVMSPALMFDREFPNRLQQAIKNAAKLKQRGIARIHDAGIHRNNIYIVSEYISGGALSQRIEAQNIDVFEALEIIRHLASALEYAHGQGVVHGDVRPANVLFRADGAAVLTDFEISRSVVSASERRAAGSLGTSHDHASPEEYAGQEIDERADLYALGVTLYEMLTGMVPYEGETKEKVAAHHRRRDIPRLPEDLKLLQPMINDLLVTEPDERTGSAKALLDVLDELETDGIPGRVVRERQEAEMAARAKRRDRDSGTRSQEIDAAGVERRRRVRRYIVWGGSLAASVILSVGGYFYWEWYRLESNPQLKVDGLLLQARKLVAEQSDLGGLVGVYREVLQISPEHPFAKSKLDELAEGLERRTLDIMADGDFDAAERLVQDSSQYFGADDMVGRLNERLVEFLGLVAILDEAGKLLEQGAVIRPEGTNA